MKKRQLVDILTAAVISVTENTVISQALGLMGHRNISCIVVLDGDRPVGIVTERNLVRLTARQRGDLDGCAVREVMSTPVITAHQDIDIFESYSILSSHSMRLSWWWKRSPPIAPIGPPWTLTMPWRRLLNSEVSGLIRRRWMPAWPSSGETGTACRSIFRNRRGGRKNDKGTPDIFLPFAGKLSYSSFAWLQGDGC